jgi:hypothetical protein
MRNKSLKKGIEPDTHTVNKLKPIILQIIITQINLILMILIKIVQD